MQATSPINKTNATQLDMSNSRPATIQDNFEPIRAHLQMLPQEKKDILRELLTSLMTQDSLANADEIKKLMLALGSELQPRNSQDLIEAKKLLKILKELPANERKSLAESLHESNAKNLRATNLFNISLAQSLRDYHNSTNGIKFTTKSTTNIPEFRVSLFNRLIELVSTRPNLAGLTPAEVSNLKIISAMSKAAQVTKTTNNKIDQTINDFLATVNILVDTNHEQGNVTMDKVLALVNKITLSHTNQANRAPLPSLSRDYIDSLTLHSKYNEVTANEFWTTSH